MIISKEEFLKLDLSEPKRLKLSPEAKKYEAITQLLNEIKKCNIKL